VKIKEPIIILAGGFGTRLKTITRDKPKALADINGTPFIKILIDKLIKNGFNNFIFSLHFGASMIIDYLDQVYEKDNLNFKYIVEKKPLGTGGAISFVISELKIHNYFYVTNADTLLSKGYNSIIEENKNIILSVKYDLSSRFGTLKIKDNKIIDFLEKDGQSKNAIINAGFYKLNANDFPIFNNKSFSIEKDLFPKLVSKKNLYTKTVESQFIDIGVPEDYNLLTKKIKNDEF
tara:strand:- start:1997 stop:2698 length:702 start_codon:yes stop_codon:yes gene_type:complete